MLGLKEICGLALLFGLLSGAPTTISKDDYLDAIKGRAGKLLETFKKGAGNFPHNLLAIKNVTVSEAFPEGLPDCSQHTPTNRLAFVEAYNTLFNSFVNTSDKCLTKAVKGKLIAVIEQVAALLRVYPTKSETELIKPFKMPSSDCVEQETIYLYIFKRFKNCMDHLSA